MDVTSGIVVKAKYHSELPPQNAKFDTNNNFLKNFRSFNKTFSFSVLGVIGGFQRQQTDIS